jgi:hypothetical protein
VSCLSPNFNLLTSWIHFIKIDPKNFTQIRHGVVQNYTLCDTCFQKQVDLNPFECTSCKLNFQYVPSSSYCEDRPKPFQDFVVLNLK